jgi:hypothetical protein
VTEKKNRRAGDRAVDGRRADAALGPVQLVEAQLLGCGRIGRSAEEGSEGLDLADVVVLRLLHEVADRHVFDHAPPQRAEGHLGHRVLLS